MARLPRSKKGRNGDFAPQFHCASFRHAQWIRQVRRLQSFVHFVCNQPAASTGQHALALWGAILRAKGFPPNFCTWWSNCKFRVHGAPNILPVIPPHGALAEKIFDSVALAVRSFEAQLKKSSRAYARLRREKNPNLIFQDIKCHADKGIDLLIQPREAKVLEVNHEDLSITVDRSFDADCEKPVVCGGKPLTLIHAEDDCLCVEDTTSVNPGDTVVQTCPIGCDQDLFDTFMNAWKEKWMRHADVPGERWKPILDFARDKLPSIELPHLPMTPQHLHESINQKKSATSRGLDGVSLQDLKALPMPALQNFCDMFQWAEDTGQWPSQVIAGKVTSLAKVEQPRGPMDFRPITVFGLLYCCWGSFHSKRILQTLDPVLPVGLFGSRPRCFAGQVWSQVLWSIEHSQMNGVQLCGILADLQKAVNLLPRLVVFEACAVVGIPMPVLVGWAGALSSMPRRFQIRQSLSPAIYSTCGFPEGDALSCVAMMVIDIIYHEWFHHFMPMVQPISYVDDWQLLMCDPALLAGTVEKLDVLVQHLDLLLDRKKTSIWSVHPAGRKMLREGGFSVSAHCKNLGAHLQTTRQHTNSVQMERVQTLAGLWSRLRLSSCPYAMKVRALKCAAWPKGLHAIAATTLSLSTFQSLRAGAMRGLKEDHSGSNAHLHLGLVEAPSADPHYWCILQTFRFVKDCGRADVVKSVLAQMVEEPTCVSNSITATLLTRIQFLGWHSDAFGCLVDDFGAFSLFMVSCVELQLRLEWQWLSVVSCATSHRGSLGGLQDVWPQSTRLWLSCQSPSDQALYRKLLNGTHVTQDGKKHCHESESDICPYCMCSDSRFHRFWICEHFEWARDAMPTELRNQIPPLPEAVTCFGWDLRPSTLHEWWSYFVSLQCPSPLPLSLRVGRIHLFTDGSCTNQSMPHLRFAAWAIVLASSAADDLSDAHIVESGHLPGLLQSAVRAEIFAVMRALEIAVSAHADITIWTDCQAVVSRLRKILHGSHVRPSSSHADLWLRIADCVQLCHGGIIVAKVAAHRAVSEASNPLEEWCFRHNMIADREAVAANSRRSAYFWNLHARHVQALQYVTQLNEHVRKVLLLISREVVRSQDSAADPPLLDQPSQSSLPLPVWHGLSQLHLPDKAKRWYGDSLVRVILSWFWDVLFTSTAPMVWVSHLQLYADFMGATGHPGPVKLQGWKDGAQIPFLALHGFTYRQRTRWFIKLLKECLRHAGQSIHYSVGLPNSHMVCMHTGVIAVPWPSSRLEAVDAWMYSCVPHTFQRQTKAVDSLPYVTAIAGLESTVISSW